MTLIAIAWIYLR